MSKQGILESHGSNCAEKLPHLDLVKQREGVWAINTEKLTLKYHIAVHRISCWRPVQHQG